MQESRRAHCHDRSPLGSRCVLCQLWLLATILMPTGCGPTVSTDNDSSGPPPEVRVPLAQTIIDREHVFGAKKLVTAKQIADQLDVIFPTKPADLKPGVLIFPVTDGQGAVRADGLGLSYQSLIVLSQATEQPRVAVYPDVALDTLRDAGCDRFGSVLTPDMRAACTRSVDAGLSASAALIKAGTNWELNVSFFDPDGTPAGKPLKHAVPRGKLNLIPGIIAGDACDRLNITLTSDERTRLLQPQVGTDEDSVSLTRLLKDPLSTVESQVQAERFLRSNPRCLGAWRRVVNVLKDPVIALQWRSNIDSPPQDLGLDLQIASRLFPLGFGERSFSDLQRVSSKSWGDRDVGLQVLRQALKTGDLDLVDRALDVWRSRDLTFMARVARAQFLTDWASSLVPVPSTDSGASSEFSERYRRCLAAARTELEAAIEMNPRGWQAHNLLISLATAEGRPRDDMERHFAAAITNAPGNVSAYRRKLLFLSPHQHGSVEDAMTFAEECVRTGRWSDRIPQLMVEAVDLVTCDPHTAATSFAAFRNERLWQAIQVYRDAAEQQPQVADRRNALNYFVLWAARCGHAKDVAEHFKKMKDDYEYKVYDPTVFQSPFAFGYLREQSLGKSGEPLTDLERTLRFHLDQAEFERAEEQMGLVEEHVQHSRDSSFFPQRFKTHQIAISLGRQLLAERRMELSAEELMNIVFTNAMWDQRPLLSIDNRDFRWSPKDSAAEMQGYFPLGIRHGIVSGQVKFTGKLERFDIVLHARALRDLVTIRYLPEENRGCVIRSRRELTSFPLDKGSVPFRFEFGAQEDVIEPIPGKQLRTPVVDNVISTFAFDAASGPGPSSLTITGLRIELLD